MQGVGFCVLADRASEHIKVLTQSRAKRSWTTITVQNAALLNLPPFKKTPELRVTDDHANGGNKNN